MIRFAFLRGISGFWVKNGLGATVIKAEFLTVFCKPGLLALNIGHHLLIQETRGRVSKSISLNNDSIGI